MNGLGFNPWETIGGGYFQPQNYLAQATGGSPWYMPELAGGFGGMAQVASVPMTLNNMFTYRDPSQSWLGGGLSGAASGALSGSMFGPWGTGIGAGLGYIGGKK